MKFEIRFSAVMLAALILISSQTGFAQRLDRNHEKSGDEVLKAFRKVVEAPRKTTVEILDGEKPVALGAIVGADGWILTKATELHGNPICRLWDDREFPAEIIGVHLDYDLAMLRIEAANLPVVKWNTDDDPPLGRWVVSPGIGELPAGVGVVSVKRRAISPDKGVLGISISEVEDLGIKITKVFPNSGAEEAGLIVGDIITGFSGKVVKTTQSLSSSLGEFRPGDFVLLRVLRGTQEIDLVARLYHPPGDNLSRGSIQNRLGGGLSIRRAGFALVLQHDTVLEPNECGGPLIDLSGKTIGINVARAGRTESYAIPASEIQPLLDKLKTGELPPPVPAKSWMSIPPAPPLPEPVN